MRKAVARLASSSTLRTGSQLLRHGLERLLLLPLVVVVVIIVVSSGGAAGAGAWTDEGRERRERGEMPCRVKPCVQIGRERQEDK